MTYAFGFNILRFLHNELNYHVWDPAISEFTWLRNRLKHIPDRHAEFDVSRCYDGVQESLARTIASRSY